MTATFDFDRVHERLQHLRNRQIFFILGAMKSGTTWVQLLLDALPGIACRGEGHFMDTLWPLLGEAYDKYNAVIAEKNTSVFKEVSAMPLAEMDDVLYALTASISLLLAKLADGRDAAAVGEKTPDNVSGLPILARMFPAAKFIHVIRDGRDCAVSAWFHNLRLSEARATGQYGTLDRFAPGFASTWASVLEAALDFEQNHPGRLLPIRYEDMVLKPEETVGRMLEFLGIPVAEDDLRAGIARASFSRLSGGRTQGQEDPASFFRKGTAGDWRNHMDAETEAAFSRLAGAWLVRYEYR